MKTDEKQKKDLGLRDQKMRLIQKMLFYTRTYANQALNLKKLIKGEVKCILIPKKQRKCTDLRKIRASMTLRNT